jgi:hypothetical protein
MIACKRCLKKVRFAITYDNGVKKEHCIKCFNEVAPEIIKDFFLEFFKRGLEQKLGVFKGGS